MLYHKNHLGDPKASNVCASLQGLQVNSTECHGTWFHSNVIAQTLEPPPFFPMETSFLIIFPAIFSKAHTVLGQIPPGRQAPGLKLGWKRLCLSEYKRIITMFTSGIAKITSSLSTDRLVWKAATISNQPCRLAASPSGHQDHVQLFPNLLVHILIFRCLAISYGPRLGTHKRDCWIYIYILQKLAKYVVPRL